MYLNAEYLEDTWYTRKTYFGVVQSILFQDIKAYKVTVCNKLVLRVTY